MYFPKVVFHLCRKCCSFVTAKILQHVNSINFYVKSCVFKVKGGMLADSKYRSTGTSGISHTEIWDSEGLLLLISLDYTNSSHARCQNADRLQQNEEKLILWKTTDNIMVKIIAEKSWTIIETFLRVRLLWRLKIMRYKAVCTMVTVCFVTDRLKGEERDKRRGES